MGLAAVAFGPAMILGSPAPQDELGTVGDVIASAWSAGQVGQISEYLHPDGVDLQLDGPVQRRLPQRQIAAALRRLRSGFTQMQAELARASEVGQGGQQAFVEVSWRGQRDGGGSAEGSLFIALVRHANAWRIVEVRIVG